MRRQVLADSISKILGDITKSDIHKSLELLMVSQHEKRDDGVVEVLPFLTAYMIAVSKYSDVETGMLDSLTLKPLSTPLFWQKADMQETRTLGVQLRRLIEIWPTLEPLIRQAPVTTARGESDESQESNDTELLSVLITEDERQFSSPNRLAHVLDSISDLYSVFARIDEVNENDLVVVACDSGSDKSFDFRGAVKQIEQVKDLLMALFKRAIFYKHLEARESLSLIAESLPIVEKISALEKAESIGPEDAELLRRKAISGVTSFLTAGATIKEMDGESYHDPRLLMAPKPELLEYDAGKATEDTTEKTKTRQAAKRKKVTVSAKEKRATKKRRQKV